MPNARLCKKKGCIDSVECGTVEWNSGTVEWWNSGMAVRSIDDPVPSTAVFMGVDISQKLDYTSKLWKISGALASI